MPDIRWFTDRYDPTYRPLCDAEDPGDDGVLADARPKLSALIARRDIEDPKQTAMWAEADSVPALTKARDAIEKAHVAHAAAAELAEREGRIEDAISETQAAQVAASMLAAKDVALAALVERCENWPFAEKARELDELDEQIAVQEARVNDVAVRLQERVAIMETIQAAKAKRSDTLMQIVRQEQRELDPAVVAERVYAEGQAKIEAREALTAGSRPVPQKPRTNADPRVAALAAKALASISHGGRVDPMPFIHTSTGGPTVPARVGQS